MYSKKNLYKLYSTNNSDGVLRKFDLFLNTVPRVWFCERFKFINFFDNKLYNDRNQNCIELLKYQVKHHNIIYQ